MDPIPMILYCPVCFTQHVDKPAWTIRTARYNDDSTTFIALLWSDDDPG